MTFIHRRFRPWSCTGTELSPNLLLMAKLLALILLRGEVWHKVGDPFLPYLAGLDQLQSSSGWFGLLLRAALVVGSLSILFNVRPATGCLVSGTAVILWQFGDTPAFRNHIYICGCLLFLAGCHRGDGEAWLIRWQFALLYAGAALNKLLQPDWWSGQMLLTWLTQELPAGAFRQLSRVVAAPMLAQAMSWFTIITEVALALCFLRRKWIRPAVWLVLLLHGAMFVFLVGYRFGHFVEDILVGLLAFLAWPTLPLELRVQVPFARQLRRLFRFLHPDDTIRMEGTSTPGHWLELHGLPETQTDEAALRTTLLLAPGFYLSLFLGDWLLERLLVGLDLYRYVSVGAALALLAIFIPVPWPRFGRQSRANPPR